MKTGVIITPPYNPESLDLIKYGTNGAEIISNYKLSIPHKFAKFSDKPALWGTSDVIIPEDDVQMNLSNPIVKQIAYTIEIAKRTNNFLVVYPNMGAINMLQLLIATSLNKPFHVIVGNQPIKDSEITRMIQSSDQEVLKKQYQALINPNIEIKEYRDDELIRTPNGAKLRQYQQQMVDFVLEKKKAGLFVDMGLGKTLATLATINKLVETGEIPKTKPILIVAPITVALDTWSREAEKWGYDFNVEINIKLTKRKRAELLDRISKPLDKVTLVTTNPAQIGAILQYYNDTRQEPPFSMFVIDELSMFKSHQAKRFDEMVLLGRNSKYAIGLTGTPAPNNLLDLWSQLMVIDPNNRKYIYDNYYIYREQFFVPAQTGANGQVYKWKIKKNAQYEIFNRIKNAVIAMQSKGLVDLPDIVYTNHYVKLPPKARKLYDEVDTDYRKELLKNQDVLNYEIRFDTRDDGESEASINNLAILTSKLIQIASGAIYDAGLPGSTHAQNHQLHYTELHDAKMQALKDIVENATSPILVFFYYKSELDRLSKYIDFEHLNPKRKDFNDLISRWNRGEVPVMVAHPGSAGHGLNLQDGGHTIVWLTTTWSNEQYRQANKRLHRSGQENTVSVIHIVAEDTIDMEVIERINEKEKGQSQLLEELDVAVRAT